MMPVLADGAAGRRVLGVAAMRCVDAGNQLPKRGAVVAAVLDRLESFAEGGGLVHERQDQTADQPGKLRTLGRDCQQQDQEQNENPVAVS